MVHQSDFPTIHCINPHCPNPIQSWGNKYCQSCGTPLLLNDRYIPLKPLGLGGFAKIYTVWDLRTQTERILKVLIEASPKALELFDQEAWVLTHLRHPGIPQAEPGDYFYLQKRNNNSYPGHHPTNWRLPCLVMEKINGLTLEEVLEQHPEGCPQEWVISWLTKAIEILWELHRQGIIHRDIKPSNLMLRMARTDRQLIPLQRTEATNAPLVAIDLGGAKQIGPWRKFPPEMPPKSSTRLISPGYSPPEQMTGGEIGPPADFFALGRTCIHLLTGKYPADLEDPSTGELEWRGLCEVNSSCANLLDLMVNLNVKDRPKTAAEISVRLAKIHRYQKRATGAIALVKIGRGLKKLTNIISKIIDRTVAGCLDTLWEAVLGGIGGCVGASLGLVLAYWSALGDAIADILANEWFQIADLPITFGEEVLVFALAGLFTAIALTDTGSFSQDRRYGWAAFMGAIGYVVGGLCWEVAKVGVFVFSSADEVMAFELLGKLSVGIAIAILSLGLGLKSHKFAQAVVVAVGVAMVFVGLESVDIFPRSYLQFVSVSGSTPSLFEFVANIGFFGLLGSVGGVCLGASHYLIVPVLRWLGLR
ncbi:MAG: serine/threonine protein kinase [Okeania sp. SIO2H7]|nr:serine/threonine protein kinase [Okeania sp. SIO2H7]